MSSQRPSLAGRAILAVALLIGFYVLAFAIAAGLAWLPFSTKHFPIKLSLMCLFGAAVILWSILPRIDKFEAPGPELSREKHPRLFDEIESVAALTKQPMPEHVYVVNDVNAFVTQRGGLMGFGSKRVMGVGLPLMHGLTVSELRAVIAHEFGHFHGGDTAVGPWIYKTRGAIGRTIQNLVASGSSILHKPFLWYGNFFMYVTQSVSRAQELAADRLAADVVGPKALAGGLRKLSKLAAGFTSFLKSEFVPVMNAGLRPPLLTGFQKFLDHPNIATQLDKLGEFEEKEREGDAFDSHPPLKQRIAALESVATHDSEHDTRRASGLFDDLAGVELELLAFHVRGVDVNTMPRVEWEHVCEKVLIPQWRESCAEQKRALAGLAAKDLAPLGNDANALHSKFALPSGTSWKEQTEFGHRILDAALALALQRSGWTISTQPGGAIIATRGGEKLEPFGVMHKLAKSKAAEAEWVATCERLGIANLSLEIPA